MVQRSWESQGSMGSWGTGDPGPGGPGVPQVQKVSEVPGVQVLPLFYYAKYVIALLSWVILQYMFCNNACIHNNAYLLVDNLNIFEINLQESLEENLNILAMKKAGKVFEIFFGTKNWLEP